ncbi:MAG: beta/gamma crystallin family protein [Alphaproteobacteria bacterium]|nr:beta/gamma crystallin family protein [Alphaproteobacteria bacterium]
MSRPPSVNPAFVQPRNAPEITPSVQHVNPGLPFNNPTVLRPNIDNAPHINPNVLRPNIDTVPRNVQEVAPSVQRVNPSASVAPPARVTLKPLVSPAPLRGGASGTPQTAPAFAAVRLHDRFWPIRRDSKFIWLRGQRRLVAPVGVLGVALIGGSYWYPDGYVSTEGPACTGFTADGCQLQWRMVDIEDGGSEPQCVQYCPQAAPPAPEEVATLPPPPPALPEDNGVCQTTIYSEPNFAGNSAPTGGEQPTLSQSGWRDEISSIVVGAGVWEFFADEDFAGESMLLPPGTYATLPAGWTKRIGSFMCVRPQAPPA